METFVNESKSVEITDFTEMGQFYGRRAISQKMSRPWNRELGWSLDISSDQVPANDQQIKNIELAWTCIITCDNMSW